MDHPLHPYARGRASGTIAGMKNWKKWAIWAPVAAWVLLVVAMFVSEDVLLAVGWTTPVFLLFLGGAAVIVAAAVKYLRKPAPSRED
jgi:hypothetical protein